jgi:hypothetical protein
MLCYVMLVCMDETLVMYGHSVLCNLGHSNDETCMSVCMMKSGSNGHSVSCLCAFIAYITIVRNVMCCPKSYVALCAVQKLNVIEQNSRNADIRL